MPLWSIYNPPVGGINAVGTPPGSGGAGPIVPGNAPSAYSPAYGGIPTVPDPAAAQQATIGANLGALGGLESFGGQLTAAQQQQLLAGYNAAIPNYAGLTGQSSANIANNLAGQISPDVLNLLQQQGAERGIMTGSPGSPNANSAYLRALGLTSMGLQQLGSQQLNAATAAAPVQRPFDISSMLLNPNDVYSARQLANLYASAPSPGAAGTAGIGDFRRGFQDAYNQAAQGGLPGGQPYTPIPRSTTPGGAGPNWNNPVLSPPPFNQQAYLNSLAQNMPQYGPPMDLMNIDWSDVGAPQTEMQYGQDIYNQGDPYGGLQTGYEDYTDPASMMGYQDFYSDYGG